jgi:hypothetical protein
MQRRKQVSRFIRRPSASLVVACLALLVALGGTSYATVLNVPRNSVGPINIKRNAVGPQKIAPNAVRTAHVLNGSLLTADFKAGQIPQGPKGDKGDPGPRGASGYETLRNQTASNSSNPKQVSADCPAGKRAVGGSARLFGTINEVALTASSNEGPVGASNQWFAAAREVGAGTAASWGLRVDVICLDVG